MELEYCLVLLKPDAVELSLSGELISHLEHEDMHIVGMKAVEVDRELAAAHYYEHRDKPYYKDIIKYLMGKYHSFPWVYAYAYCGEEACSKIRNIIGRTNPRDFEKGKKIITLRQKYGRNVIVRDENRNECFDEQGHVVVRYENVIHASYGDLSEYEIKLWFKPHEIISRFRLFPTVSDGNGGLDWEISVEEVREKIFRRKSNHSKKG